MIVAAVRRIGSKKFLGIFWGPNVQEIGTQVDHLANPYAFEYRSLTHGGFHYSDKDTPVVPFARNPQTNESYEFDLPPVVFSDDTSAHLDAEIPDGKGRWTKFTSKNWTFGE